MFYCLKFYLCLKEIYIFKKQTLKYIFLIAIFDLLDEI